MSRAVASGEMSSIRRIFTKRPHFLEVHDKEDKTPLMQAIENGNLNVLAFLINMGANVNTATFYTRRTPLMLAVFKGKLQMAQLLCDKGAAVDLKDINGLNVLHYAVDSNFLASVEFALKLISDVDEKDNSGFTPLTRGIILKCDLQILITLLKHQANWEAKDKNGFSCEKHWKMTYGHDVDEKIKTNLSEHKN